MRSKYFLVPLACLATLSTLNADGPYLGISTGAAFGADGLDDGASISINTGHSFDHNNSLEFELNGIYMEDEFYSHIEYYFSSLFLNYKFTADFSDYFGMDLGLGFGYTYAEVEIDHWRRSDTVWSAQSYLSLYYTIVDESKLYIRYKTHYMDDIEVDRYRVIESGTIDSLLIGFEVNF